MPGSVAPAVVFLSLSLFSASAAQAADPAAVCAAKQIKCVDKLAKGLFKCSAKAGKNGDAVANALCAQAVAAKFSDPDKGCMAKAEAKGGCTETGIDGALSSATVAYWNAVFEELDSEFPTVNLCASKKNGCVGKKTSGLLKCYAKAAKKTAAVDPSCLLKAMDKFDGGDTPSKGCFEKFEAKGGCLTEDDTADIEALVDAFVEAAACVVDAALCPPPTTTTSSTTTTTVVSGPCLTAGALTVTDSCNMLEWEKKDTTAGSGADLGNPNDVDNRYAWAGQCSIGGALCQPNAAAADACATQTGGGAPEGCSECGGGEGSCQTSTTTIWDWLGALNLANFAGENDWRLPTSQGAGGSPTGDAAELESIVDGGFAPTIDPIFGPTAGGALDFYYSASTRTTPALPGQAAAVSFDSGATAFSTKESNGAVRAVRDP